MSGNTRLSKAVAAFRDGTGDRDPPTVETLKRVAREYNVLVRDEDGFLAVPAELIPLFRRHWLLTGYLKPRHCKSLAEMQQAMMSEDHAQ
jgi:hypothetical protein